MIRLNESPLYLCIDIKYGPEVDVLDPYSILEALSNIPITGELQKETGDEAMAFKVFNKFLMQECVPF